MNNQSRPIAGSAGQQHGDHESFMQMAAGSQNLSFSPPMNDAGHVNQFAAQYPNGYHQYDPGYASGSSAPFSLEAGNYHLINTTWTNEIVQQQGSNFMPPWSQFSSTEYQNSLNTTSLGQSYPLGNSSFSGTMSVEQAASASWNGASRSPAAGSGSGSLTCKIQSCSVACNTQREMTRHMNTIHGDKEYACKCSYSTTRKDNFVRHLTQTCKKARDPDSHQVSTCICGEKFDDYNRYLAHVKECGKQRAGRRSSRRAQ